MSDIFKSRAFWEKIPFYRRKSFLIPVFILVIIAFFLLNNGKQVQEKLKIEDVLKFNEEVEHFYTDVPIFFNNVSFKVLNIDKSYQFFNEDLGIGVQAIGVFYLVTFEISNEKSKLEKFELPTIILVGQKGIYSRDKDAESLAKNPLKSEEVPLDYSIKRLAIFDVPVNENVHLEINLTGYRAILDQ